MRRPGRWSPSTLAALDCFLVLGFLGIYLKFALLGPHWTAIGRFMGVAAPENLPLAPRLGFFFDDIWLNLLAIPLAGTLIVAVAFRRYRAAAAVGVSAAMGVVYFIELQVQKEVGQYLSIDAVRDLVWWVMSSSGSALDYLTLTSLWKLAGFFAALGAIVTIERLANRARDSHQVGLARLCSRLLWVPAAITLIAAVAVMPVALAMRLPASPLVTSSVARAAAMLMQGADREEVIGAGGTFEAFRQLTHTEPFDDAHPHVGHERDSDLIIFMMETGAAQALDLAVVGRDLPGIGPLSSRAFVTSRHYTTHPYSSDALYSVFSGRYPHGRRRVLRKAGPGALKGLMTNLSVGVPMRRVYVPSLYGIEGDDRMYEAFGADLVYASDEHGQDPLREVAQRRAAALVDELERDGIDFEGRARARLVARLRADFQALEKAKRDIREAIAARRRYAVMFFPQIGHGPWQPLHDEPTVLERGRALMLLQDTWLREMLDVVRGLGRLDRTVVVVTSDHGVRTRTEDPILPVGQISDYMFRVPLLVYAPQTLSSTVRIDEPTSHIDLTPTVLALLGQTGDLAETQGVPLWQRSTRRRIYLLAFAYGGADGFVQDGRYYMRQGLSGATFVSNRFHFEDRDQVAADDPVSAFVDEGLRRLDATQQGIVTRTLDAMTEIRFNAAGQD